MRTILDEIPPELRDDPGSAESMDAQSARMAAAYAKLFTGAGGQADAELVLVDLAAFARYYDTANASASSGELHRTDGKRAVFQRILEGMTRAGYEPTGLLSAVLRTPRLDTTEES